MNIKNLAMWAIIVFLTLYSICLKFSIKVRGGNQVIFSEFLTSVDNGEVLKVDLGNNIKGVIPMEKISLLIHPTIQI